MTPLTFIIFAVFIAPTVSIQCWNCVGPDCNTYRASSKNWELVTCPFGAVCQKTDFTYYSNEKNQSYVMYTIHSCSYETGCYWDRSRGCEKNAVQYTGRGCVDRFCCGKDKCNGSQGVSTLLALFFVLIFSMF